MSAALLPKNGRIASALLGAERAYTRKDYARCSAYAGQVLKAQPEHLQALKLQAYCAIATGEDGRALGLFERLIKVNPNDRGSRLNLAKLLVRQGKHANAVPLLQELSSGDSSDGLSPALLLAECLVQIGREAEAVTLYNRLVAQHAESPEAFIEFGKLLHRLGQHETALELIEIGLLRLPDQPDLLFCKAILLAACGMTGLALEVFTRLEGTAGYSLAYELRHINLLCHFRKFDLAFDKYRAILARNPSNKKASVGYARALYASSCYSEAFNFLESIRPIFPDDLEISYLLAVSAFGKRDYKGAQYFYGEVFKLSPSYPGVAGFLLYASSFICDWSEYSAIRSVIDQDREFTASSVFPSVLFDSDPALNLGYAQSHARSIFGKPRVLGSISKNNIKGRMKIGYYSADFYTHATMMLIEGMLKAHDRSRFELYAFSLNPTPPDTRHQRTRELFDHYHDVSTISDSAVALLSRKLEIDIAIDLKGYTKGSRPGIFAERAAPIQINYLGFPGTMGAPFIDYMVADHYTVNPENRPFFSEKIIYLPHCYQPNSPHRPKPASDVPRPSELPGGAFVYCSFNNVYKLTPIQFDLWIRVLKQTPGSVLWLLKSTDQAQINLTKRAADAGLDPQRIIFAPMVPEAEHLQRVSFADCFLDSFPCNAHTTASDAVWAGVPLITRSGKTFASRVAGSILTTIGLPELIVEDDAAYEALALRAYNDRAYLADLKRRVKEGVQNGPLYNAELYARHFEQALLAIYEGYHKGQPLNDLAILA